MTSGTEPQSDADSAAIDSILPGGGEMGAMMRAHDWSTSSIGSPVTWPQSLRSVVGMMLANKHFMFVAWGPDLAMLYNDGYAPALGAKHPWALGRPFREVWSDIWDDIEPLVNKALGGEATWSENLPFIMQRNGYPEESWFTFSYSPLRNESGRIAGLFCAGTETTAQVLANRSMTAERERLFEMSRDLFGVATFDGYLKSINPAWSGSLDRPHEELTSRPFSEIIHPDDLAKTADVIATLQRGEPVHQFFVRLLKADGTPLCFAWSAVPDAGGSTGIFYTVGRDITEDERREALLRQSQKIEAIGQLTGGVAHDFNNLLMVISGGLNLLERSPSDEKRRRLMDGMRHAVDRGASLSRQLLAFSRRRPLAPEPVNLRQQIHGMSELLDRTLRGDVHVETRLPDHLWPVAIDPAELELVVLNLCVNARDAMPDGGTITIAAENAHETGSELNGEYVRLSVIDTGTGMSPEVMAKVFEPFFTTKEIGKGSGLGLAQVYGFAKQSEGAVRVRSAIGEGTTVELLLPRSHSMPASETRPVIDFRDDATMRTKAGTILLVEDDDEVATLVTEMLGEMGYEVTRAASAQAALGALANDRPVDIVFSDIMMPGGMNGVELAREVRRRRPGLPILLTSGYAEAAARDAAAENIKILAKPYELPELQAALNETRT